MKIQGNVLSGIALGVLYIFSSQFSETDLSGINKFMVIKPKIRKLTLA
jgi:hypothetical protein